MSLTIARRGAPSLHVLRARVLRALAVAVLAVGVQVPLTVAAAGGSTDLSIQHAIRAPVAAIAAADAAGSTGVPLNDDGEDHFDEGDDGFNCDNVNEGEDPCQDNPPDRVDAGDDEFDAGDEGGCVNYDDGNDRCLGNGGDRYDAGDDEFDVGCANYDDGEDRCLDNREGRLDAPLPSRATLDAELTATSPAAGSKDSTTGVAALAAVIALGAGACGSSGGHNASGDCATGEAQRPAGAVPWSAERGRPRRARRSRRMNLFDICSHPTGATTSSPP